MYSQKNNFMFFLFTISSAQLYAGKEFTKIKLHGAQTRRAKRIPKEIQQSEQFSKLAHTIAEQLEHISQPIIFAINTIDTNNTFTKEQKIHIAKNTELQAHIFSTCLKHLYALDPSKQPEYRKKLLTATCGHPEFPYFFAHTRKCSLINKNGPQKNI